MIQAIVVRMFRVSVQGDAMSNKIDTMSYSRVVPMLLLIGKPWGTSIVKGLSNLIKKKWLDWMYSLGHWVSGLAILGRKHILTTTRGTSWGRVGRGGAALIPFFWVPCYARSDNIVRWTEHYPFQTFVKQLDHH